MDSNDRVFANSDELMRQMELDEIEDAIKATPREYGKLRGIQPQLVYYHIREGHIKKEHCICGRPVIDIDLADQYFKKGKHDGNQDQEEG